MGAMSTLNVSIKIDRHNSGNARIFGKIGEQPQDVNVWKGPQPGDCYVEGNQNSAPTTLRINSGIAEHGHKVFGRLAGGEMKGQWDQEPSEGDAKLFLNKAQMEIDQNPQTGVTEANGTRVRSTTSILNDEGDEDVALTVDGQRITMSVDRHDDGAIDVRGRDGGQQFRLHIDRKGKDGDLTWKGSLPEKLSMLPLMWELYGNDSKEPPAKPLSFGAAAALGAFYQSQI